jgi:hypothetical protein
MFEREETIDERYRLSKSRLGDSFLSGWQANISSSGSNRRSQVARSRKKRVELKEFYERIPPGIESFSRKRAEMRGNMSNLSSAIPPSRRRTWITRAAWPINLHRPTLKSVDTANQITDGAAVI